MRKLLVLLCLLLLACPALAEYETVTEGQISYPVFGTAADAAVSDALGLPSLLARQGAGQQISVTFTVCENGERISAVFFVSGQLDAFTRGQKYVTVNVNRETGAPLTLEDYVTDVSACVERMEAQLEETNGGQQSGYLECCEFLPLPRDCFFADATGLTFYYDRNSVRLLSGVCGSYRFYIHEILGEKPEIDGDSFWRLTDSLPGYDLRLGDDIGDMTALCDPDYTYTCAYHYPEEPRLDGLTPVTAQGDSVIIGLLARRGCFAGICPGVTTREDALSILGEGECVPVDGETAWAYQLETGLSDTYAADGVNVTLYSNENGVIYALLLGEI